MKIAGSPRLQLTGGNRSIDIAKSVAHALGKYPFYISALTDLQKRGFEDIYLRRDTFIHSTTGSGKTLAAILPILSRIVKIHTEYDHPRVQNYSFLSDQTPVDFRRNIQCDTIISDDVSVLWDKGKSRDADYTSGVNLIVISPTQELVQQFSHVLTHLTARSKCLRHISISGGQEETTNQITWLNTFHRPNILISTPGRLLSLLTNSHFRQLVTGQLDSIIVDEIEKFSTEKFIPQFLMLIEALCSHDHSHYSLEKSKHLVFLSATTNTAVESLCRQMLGNGFLRLEDECEVATKIGPWKNSVPSTLSNYVVLFAPEDLQETIESLIWYLTTDWDDIQELKPKIIPRRLLVIIFPTVRMLQFFYVCTRIRRRSRKAALGNLRICALHSRLPPEKRRSINAEVLSGWSEESTNRRLVLFTTDLASRGLDFPLCNVISVLEAPAECNENRECTEIHRAGRTARMGNAGSYIKLCCNLLYSLKSIIDIPDTGISSEDGNHCSSAYREPKRGLESNCPNSDNVTSGRGSLTGPISVLDVSDILRLYRLITEDAEKGDIISLFRERDPDLIRSYCLGYRSLISYLAFQQDFNQTFRPGPLTVIVEGVKYRLCHSICQGFDLKCILVSMCNRMILSVGFDLFNETIPTITRKFARKVSLDGVPGIRIGNLREEDK